MVFDWAVVFQVVTVMCLNSTCTFYPAPCEGHTQGTLVMNSKSKAVIKICQVGKKAKVTVDKKAIGR